MLRPWAVRTLCLALLGGPIAACSTTVGVKDVYVSLDQDGARKRSEFFTDSDTIFCVVELSSARSGVTLEVLIRQVSRINVDNGKDEGVNRVLGASDQAVNKGTAQRISVPLDRPELEDKDAADATTAPPFSAGDYQCEVSIDGAPQSPVPFVISLARCPAAEIKAGTLCLGYYQSGTECPRYGETSRENAKCTCEGSTKKWKC